MMQHPTIHIEPTDEQQEYYDHIEHLCNIIEDQVASGNDVSVERIMPDILSGSAYLTNVQDALRLFVAPQTNPMNSCIYLMIQTTTKTCCKQWHTNQWKKTFENSSQPKVYSKI